jgi:hypothetical protein
MSGSEAGRSAIEQILQNVDVASIQDERARECIRLLLNLVETLTVELQKAQAENRYLREQLHGRKGGGGKPDSSKGTSPPASRFGRKPSLRNHQNTKRKTGRIPDTTGEVSKVDRRPCRRTRVQGFEDVVVGVAHRHGLM